jgi:hypothetical protein
MYEYGVHRDRAFIATSRLTPAASTFEFGGVLLSGTFRSWRRERKDYRLGKGRTRRGLMVRDEPWAGWGLEPRGAP